VGKNGSLGLEAATTFAADLNDGSTGLETRAGIELILDLFPRADRGLRDDKSGDAHVRLELKDAAFTWWNTFQTTGGNYEQDDFNSWAARPLILSFDTLTADVVWNNYFFRIAATDTVMRTNLIALRSIFDDVMDYQDRFYVAHGQALWTASRYNIQQLPLLRARLNRDLTDSDYRGNYTGILAAGAEFSKFGLTLKAASQANGLNNNENAWLVGADAQVVPVDNLKLEAAGFAAFNYDKTTVGKNPVTFGLASEYRLPLNEKLIVLPFAGFDFAWEQTTEEAAWEAGGGAVLYTRGWDTRVSSRVLDYDDVIPIGFSLSADYDHTSRLNVLVSWFDPAGEDSLIPRFGGFLQFELGDLLAQHTPEPDIAVLAQFEYSIKNKAVPYIRGGYRPELNAAGTSKTGVTFITSAVGCFLTAFNNFSIDIRYERTDRQAGSETELDNGTLSASFTISM
jgi:hypothetical protein